MPNLFSFTKYSLARQFFNISLIILVSGMLVIGFFVSGQIKNGVINQTAIVTSLYVDSIVAPILQEITFEEHPNDQIHPEDLNQLKQFSSMLGNTPLGKNIVAFKVWLRDGEIIYSPNENLMGIHFPISQALQRSFNGEIISEISQLNKPEHAYEKLYWDTLIEIYAPVRDQTTGEIIAVVEFYLLPDDLKTEIRSAQNKSWGIVIGATALMYLLLAGIVDQASNKIFEQQHELEDQVVQLSELLNQNESLHQRVRRAAARTTASNERFLRQISSDIHDGPTQDLALALLRIDPLSDTIQSKQKKSNISKDFVTIQNALESAIKELRTISSGLRLPELDQMSPEDVIIRAIHEYEKKSQNKVSIDLEELPETVGMSVKITLYRIIQEALNNGFRHSGGKDQVVKSRGVQDKLEIEISDSGPGFDTQTDILEGHLGLAGMRERVEVLGGRFQIESSEKGGTKVYACLPLYALEEKNGNKS
ncbi:MAG: sensor histidine kinase [Anaerolineales bacterium]|nr:sensor histidine kinase [Anaerolineales bacterium]